MNTFVFVIFLRLYQKEQTDLALAVQTEEGVGGGIEVVVEEAFTTSITLVAFTDQEVNTGKSLEYFLSQTG